MAEFPRPSRRHTVEAPKLVESVNALQSSAFFAKYQPPIWASAVLSNYPGLETVQGGPSNIASEMLEQCLQLIEQTSAEDYKRSEIKWSPAKKRKEMRLPDMKYIVLTEEQRVIGFVSFMITYEDGYEVLYIYEIHFVPSSQGKGLGKKMINVVEDIGRKVGITKVMLTVFKANQRAVDWYFKLGYAEDEFSPGPRKLRNGTVKEPTYIILSKPLKD